MAERRRAFARLPLSEGPADERLRLPNRIAREARMNGNARPGEGMVAVVRRRDSMRLAGAGLVVCTVLFSAGCTKEARQLGPSVPQTRPLGDDDPRVALYQNNVYQVAQGGRYFAWYGCQGCHGEGAAGVANLSDGRWRHGGGFAQVFGSVADRHGALAYAVRVPPEQLWQLTAYVRDLPLHTPEKRRRAAVDQTAEPVGATWSGPQR